MPRLVLTLDGGGMRGLFEARVLAALEERLGRPAADVFDLVSGTSTGGIVVLFDSGPPPALSHVKVAPGDPLARDVAAATSAAPTYFDPARVAGLEGEWLDGGVGANDPTPYALALALREEPEVVVLSIGTGGFFPSYPRRLRGSLAIALRSMPGLLLYPTELVAHDTAQALDDASPTALERLRAEADRVVATPRATEAFAALETA